MWLRDNSRGLLLLAGDGFEHEALTQLFVQPKLVILLQGGLACFVGLLDLLSRHPDDWHWPTSPSARLRGRSFGGLCTAETRNLSNADQHIWTRRHGH